MEIKLTNTNAEPVIVRLIPSVNAEVNVLTQTGVVQSDNGILTVALSGSTGE